MMTRASAMYAMGKIMQRQLPRSNICAYSNLLCVTSHHTTVASSRKLRTQQLQLLRNYKLSVLKSHTYLPAT